MQSRIQIWGLGEGQKGQPGSVVISWKRPKEPIVCCALTILPLSPDSLRTT